MKARLKQVIRTAMAPALRWIQAQLAVLDQRLEVLQRGQDDLARLNEASISAHGAQIDVIGRELAQQRLLLESLELRQAEMLAELRSASAVRAPSPAAVD